MEFTDAYGTLQYSTVQLPIVSYHNFVGFTAFLYACTKDNFASALYLAKIGAQIDHKSKLGSTALMYAASRGKIRMLRYLLSLNPTAVNDISDAGNTPLMLAVLNKQHEAIRELAGREAPGTIQYIKMFFSLPITICDSGLAAAHCNLDIQDPNGMTALMHAARLGSMGSCRLLTHYGAAQAMVNAHGKKAIDLAQEKENDEIFNYLYDLSANASAGGLGSYGR